MSEIATMFANGDTTMQEIEELIEYNKYMNIETISATEAATEFVKVCLTGYRLSVEGSAATKEAAKVFGQCCVEDGLTRSHVKTGFYHWRRKDTGFAPTYGQFLANIGSRIPRERRGLINNSLMRLLELKNHD